MKAFQIVTLMLIATNPSLISQNIPYGYNEKSGKYANTGDAKIY